MKRLIPVLIYIAGYGAFTFGQNLSWFEPLKDLTTMTMCPNYWSNRSNYMCLEDIFDYKNYGNQGSKNCRCDQLCHQYRDCCMDRAYMDKGYTHGTSNQKCQQLPSSDNNVFGIYMISTCPTNWTEESTKYFCEEEMEIEEINNGSHTLTYTIPVHSKITGQFYKNLYCASCNTDTTNLTEWSFETQACRASDESKTTIDVSFNGDHWEVNFYNQTCLFVVRIFQDWAAFYEIYKPRPCILNQVSTCKSINSTAAKHCPKYLAPVYYLNRRNTVISVFKNYHCAKCNYAKNDNFHKIVCENHNRTYVIKSSTPSVVYNIRTNIKTLLNFNFINGRHVLDTAKCNYGEVYEPMFKRCVAISCGQLYKEHSGRCVLKDSSSPTETPNHHLLKSDCKKAILYPNEFIVLINKSVLLGNGKMIHPMEYEVSLDPNGTWQTLLICTDQILKIIDFDSAQQLLSQISLIISVICLCLHLLVYSLLPTLRNLPGKTLMCMSASLAFADMSFLIGSNFDHKPAACHIIGVFKHYAYLAVFFWTNIMAMDIHRTFSSASVYRVSNANKTFFKYSLYAWLCPGLIVIVAVLIDTFVKEGALKPNYGHGICWISQRPPLLLFFGVPMALILLINGVLFVLTARSIHLTAKQTKMVKRYSEKLRFVLYVKLATVLGLTWIFGFLAAIANVDVLWYPFILFTGLQGVIIFVAFTCKRKIWNLLCQKFRPSTRGQRGRQYLRDKSNLSNARSMATSAISLSLSSVNKIEPLKDIEKLPAPRHPRVDYIRVNSE